MYYIIYCNRAARIVAAGLRGNEERMRKWRENEEMKREWGKGKRMRKSEGEWGSGQRMKKWREISSLSNNFLFLLWNYFTSTLKYVTFCRKNLCIRSTRYGYEPKRLTFLRAMDKFFKDKNPRGDGAWHMYHSDETRFYPQDESQTIRRLQKEKNKLGFVDEEQ